MNIAHPETEIDNQLLVDRWIKDEQQEIAMEDLHAPFWATMLMSIKERSLENKVVLDFGCNTGGFLRFLFKQMPFQRGIGIDIAEESVKIALQRTGGLPIEYHATSTLSRFAGSVDIAFSYEVIFLLPEIEQHAGDMNRVLRQGGVYYAATGCHTEAPLWQSWQSILRETTNLKSNDYSLNQFADAFARSGFAVSARRLRHEDFISVDHHRDYFPNIADALDYYSRDIVIFRFVKLG